MSKFLEAMQLVLREDQDTVPAGWQSCKQIAADAGRATSTMRPLLAKLVIAGKCERREFKVRNGLRCTVVPFYRMLSEAEQTKGRHAVGRRRKRGQ